MQFLHSYELFIASNPQCKLSLRYRQIIIAQLSLKRLLMALLNSMILSGKFLVVVSFLQYMRLLSLSSLLENNFKDLWACRLYLCCHEIVVFDVVVVNPYNPETICLTTKVPKKLYHVYIIPLLQGNQVQVALLFRCTHFISGNGWFSCDFTLTGP